MNGWGAWDRVAPGRALTSVDPEIARLITEETARQSDGLELIASENIASLAVRQAMMSVLTDKYAEGYPGKRYYGGCEFVDKVEAVAIERVCQLFGADFANVQPHSGSHANMASYLSVLTPGDTILGMNLSHGGHLTHGHPVNFSGLLFKVVSYGVRQDTHLIDYDEVRDLAIKHKPKLIIALGKVYVPFTASTTALTHSSVVVKTEGSAKWPARDGIGGVGQDPDLFLAKILHIPQCDAQG